MPRPTRRLNLYLVPVDPERSLDVAQVSSGIARLVDEELGRPTRHPEVLGPGSRAFEVVTGGFAILRFDRPRAPVIYGNRLGGYRVTCPTCSVSLVREQAEVLGRWRRNAGRALSCPSCSTGLKLEELSSMPPAAPGRCALVLSDVGGLAIGDSAVEALEGLLGGRFHSIGSRW